MIWHKMDNHLYPLLALHFIITTFCILITIPSFYSKDDEQYLECRSHYSCGQVGNIEYPFLGDYRPSYCGHEGFKLNCLDNKLPTLRSGFQGFQVLSIDPSQQKILIARQYIWRGNSCSEIFQEITVNQTLFSLGAYVQNLSMFYDCTEEFSSDDSPNNFSCHEGNEERKGFYTVEGMEELGNLTNTCSRVNTVPVLFTPPNKVHLQTGHMREALSEAFYVGYRIADSESCSACVNSQGICGSNSSSSERFACLCRDGRHPLNCISSKSGSDLNLHRLKVVIGSVAAGSGIVVICLIICHFRLKISSFISTAFSGKIITKNDQDIEAFIRNFGPLAPSRYSFSDVKKMTNSFSHKLGQGGYGGVYKGKLSDGHQVAVKLLNSSKGNDQDFINEVASVSRTSHVNVVMLLGFCLEGKKKALIYEFMPNGSLEKFIYKDDNLKPSQCLGWDQMYEIAIGIAKGLEYLHRGCNTRILHFDIKPHNILLDKDFCPKISDFGLAKLCLKKESIVSMLDARGTIGYIAPEVFFRHFGEVSHKSDVYSYGMMVLEMVGGKNNLDAGVVHASELYFSHWIYKYIEQDKELKWHGVCTNEENEVAKKMIIAGLWCIQARPSNRPSMNKVIDMLQGSTESLQMPPEPFLTSPPRQQVHSSTTYIS